MRIIVLLSCSLLGCGGAAPVGPQPPDPGPEPRDFTEPGERPREVTAPEGSCGAFFDSEQANQVFAVLKGLATEGCRFEGVEVEGSAITLRYVRPPHPEVRFELVAGGCATEPGWKATEDLVLIASEEARTACPSAAKVVGEAVERHTLPPPQRP